VTNYKASHGAFGTALKIFARRGARTLFHDVWTFVVKVIEIQSSL